MNTWSGQPEESAWHWTPENCHKLGNVLLLLKCGTAAKREQAYQEFIELKRWFIEEEFDKYLNSLDDMRVSMGSEPLRQIMEEIRGERAPVTGWKAKEGKAIDPVMLPEMEIEIDGVNVNVNVNSPSGEHIVEIKPPERTIDPCDLGKCDINRCFNSDKYLDDGICIHKEYTPVTRYDLFITLIKRGYHALEM